MTAIRKSIPLLCMIVLAFLEQSCYKKEIQFGNSLAESYTTIIQTDTVDVNMSTYALDSFPTNNINAFLIGTYKDPVIGTVAAKPFLQLSTPTDLTIEDNAVYDSLTLILKPNKYYYGDTTKGQTITVRQLAAPIVYSYSTYIYNTTSIAEMPSALGSKYVKIRPYSDSIGIRLDDAKGLDLFSKMKQGATELSSASSFENYFYGISIGSSSDGTAVYGIDASSDSIIMRLHYHTTIPYPTTRYKDFAFSKSLYFNQILTSHAGTAFAQLLGGQELPATSSGSHAVTQPGTGLLTKLTFPTLRNILEVDPTVRLLKATLILRTTDGTYNGLYELPSNLYLAQTDATNSIGSALTDSAGTSVLRSAPVTDNIYSASASYSFNITSFINSLLSTSGSTAKGLFVMNQSPGSAANLNRAVFNNTSVESNKTQLVLSLITLKN